MVTPVQLAFSKWSHSHHPNEYYIQKRAFEAGWTACLDTVREMDLAIAELEDEVRKLKAKHGETN